MIGAVRQGRRLWATQDSRAKAPNASMRLRRSAKNEHARPCICKTWLARFLSKNRSLSPIDGGLLVEEGRQRDPPAGVLACTGRSRLARAAPAQWQERLEAKVRTSGQPRTERAHLVESDFTWTAARRLLIGASSR